MVRWVVSILFIALVGAAGVGAWKWEEQKHLIDPAWFADTPLENWANILLDVGEILTPEPLKGSLQGRGGPLTSAGILAETNRHRANEDLPPLRPNTTLDQAAQKKVADMFARQYFAHEAPDGTGPADLVTSVNYSYVRVGENLALGNFASDTALVQAWMDSEGHRANILHKGFSEIGLAVGEGIFEGSQVWLAVQTFAAPLSSCPRVDPALQKEFDQLKNKLDQLAQTLQNEQTKLEQKEAAIIALTQEIKELSATGSQKIQEGNAQIEEGNRIYKETGSREAAEPYWNRGEALHAEGQALIDQAKAKQTELEPLVAEYEAQREAFNRQAHVQREESETINDVMSRLNQQIRAFNACVE